MSSIATMDDSILAKSITTDDDDSTILDLKERIATLGKEAETSNQFIIQLERDVAFWRAKAQEETDLSDKIEDLQVKLHQATNEIKELNESKKLLCQEYEKNYIEKSQHRKEMVEFQAKINHLTSENQRLNSLMNEKLETLNSKEDRMVSMKELEKINRELEERVEMYAGENEKIKQDMQRHVEITQEWRAKYEGLERSYEEVVIQLKERERQIEGLRRNNQGKDVELRSLVEIGQRLEHSEAENARLNACLANLKKEGEDMKKEISGFQKREMELKYFKERFEITVKENEELQKTILDMDCEMNSWKRKALDLEKNSEEFKRHNEIMSKLNTEKEELMIRYNERTDALKKLKDMNAKLFGEYKTLQLKTQKLKEEKAELKKITECYEEMIEELKDTMGKKGQGNNMLLCFEEVF